MESRNSIILSRCPLPMQIFNLSDELAKFRAQLEREAGLPLQEIELNAAFVAGAITVGIFPAGFV